MDGIVVACGGALIAAVVSIVTLFLQRKWKKEDEQSGILAEIRSIKTALHDHITEQDKSEALRARRRIIDFSDECRRGVRHSEEHFESVLEDITSYEKYCSAHNDFENSKCVLSIEMIKDLYKKTKLEDDFI